MPEVYFAKKIVALLAQETTYGVDAVPVAASNALQLENVVFTPMTADELKREWIRAGFGAYPTDYSNMGASLTGELVLTGAGAAGNIPFFDGLMRCCGWASQSTPAVMQQYKLISEGFESASIYIHRGSSVSGMVHKMLGARGKWTSLKIDANGYLRLGVEILSLYASPVAAVQPANVNYGHVNMAAALPVNDTNTTFTLDTYPAVLHSLNLDSGMQVKKREAINVNDVISTARAVAGSVVIDEPPLASKNFWSVVEARTPVAMQVVHGITPGEIVQLDASRAELGLIKLGNTDGISTLEMPVTLLPSDEGDDNDLIITVK